MGHQPAITAITAKLPRPFHPTPQGPPLRHNERFRPRAEVSGSMSETVGEADVDLRRRDFRFVPGADIRILHNFLVTIAEPC